MQVEDDSVLALLPAPTGKAEPKSEQIWAVEEATSPTQLSPLQQIWLLPALVRFAFAQDLLPMQTIDGVDEAPGLVRVTDNALQLLVPLQIYQHEGTTKFQGRIDSNVLRLRLFAGFGIGIDIDIGIDIGIGNSIRIGTHSLMQTPNHTHTQTTQPPQRPQTQQFLRCGNNTISQMHSPTCIRRPWSRRSK